MQMGNCYRCDNVIEMTTYVHTINGVFRINILHVFEMITSDYSKAPYLTNHLLETFNLIFFPLYSSR